MNANFSKRLIIFTLFFMFLLFFALLIAAYAQNVVLTNSLVATEEISMPDSAATLPTIGTSNNSSDYISGGNNENTSPAVTVSNENKPSTTATNQGDSNPTTGQTIFYPFPNTASQILLVVGIFLTVLALEGVAVVVIRKLKKHLRKGRK